MLALNEIVDADTLIVVNFVLSAVSALAVIALWLSGTRRSGLLNVAVSHGLFAGGFFLLAAYYLAWWPDDLNTLVGNLMIDAGAILAYVAILQFLERPKSHLWLIAPSAALCVVEILMVSTNRTLDMGMMVVLGASARAIVTIGAGWQLWRHADPHMRPASTISAFFHFLWAAMLFTRGGWWIWSQFDQIDWDPTTAYGLMIRIVLTFVVTPSYLWMVLRQMDLEFMKQARQDPLTGIANRRVMWDCGQQAVDRADGPKTSVGLLMIDVDHFKSVNDRYGHGVGDQVLVGIAQTLSKHLRECDLLARVGGEEFMVLLPRTEHNAAMGVADRLRSAVEQVPFALDDGGTLHCTVSIGLSLFDQDAGNWDNLVLAADRALYCAKHLGRNRIETPPPVKTPEPAGVSG